MRHKYRTLAAAAFALSYLAYFAWCAPSAAHAQQSAPRTLSYQGVLQDTGTGTFATGSRILTVTLYSDANGTMKLWQTNVNTTVDKNGVFNIMLGTVDDPLPAPAAMDRPLWLGVAVDNGPEMRPLSEVTASAYALNVADNAITTKKLADGAVTTQKLAAGSVQSANLADSSVTTAKLADHSITWNKMGTDYVPYIRVNGAKVNTGNNPINFTGGDGLQVTFDTSSLSVVIRPDTTLTSINTGKGAHTQAVLSDPCLGSNKDGAAGNHNVVAGGCTNTITTPTNGNVIDYSVIAGGQDNALTNETADNKNDLDEANNYHVIGGGLDDTIITEVNSTSENHTGGVGTIAGGEDNQLVGPFWGSIGGGLSNTISTSIPSVDDDHADALQWNVIAGGNSNIIGGIPNSINQFGSYSAIGGGKGNRIGGGSIAVASGGVAGNHGTTRFGDVLNPADGSTIAGGTNNTITSAYGLIGGGIDNSGNSVGGTIAGGDTNQIHPLADAGAIGGGEYNIIDTSADHSAIGGGRFNLIQSEVGVIAGGDTNIIHPYASDAGILGGQRNLIDTGADHAMIGGGFYNTVQAPRSGIAGGLSNKILPNGTQSFVGAGYGNSSDASSSVIGGGEVNYVNYDADHSAIAGGQNNTIDTSADHSFVGSGQVNWIKAFASYGVIAGGDSNTIDSAAVYSAIGGGLGNLIQGPWCGIASGDHNQITSIGADHNFIGGGLGNIEANPSFGVIGGGDSNYMAYDAYSSVIGGGEFDTVFASRSFIGGGDKNVIYGGGPWADFSTLGGGDSNYIEATNGFLGGGVYNTVIGDNSTLGGGYINSIHANYAFLGGGDTNVVDGGSDTSALVGGYRNYIGSSPMSFLGAGDSNRINSSSHAFLGGGLANAIEPNSDHSVLVGGDSNYLASQYSAIVGGSHNSILADQYFSAYNFIGGGLYNVNGPGEFYNVIVGGDTNGNGGAICFMGGGAHNGIWDNCLYDVLSGGDSNYIGDKSRIHLGPAVSYSALLGGANNNIYANYGALGGGGLNMIDSNAIYSFLGGGEGNLIQSLGFTDTGSVCKYQIGNTFTPGYDVLGGGLNDTIRGTLDALGGGVLNMIDTNASASVLAGGDSNYVAASVGTIGGGYLNVITSAAYGATIPGGVGLIATGDGQFVAGTYNVPESGTTNDDDLAIFGNGMEPTVTARSDAFTISKGGYSTVFEDYEDVNLSHPYVGARYIDNTIAAWADVASNGVMNHNFGVQNVVEQPAPYANVYVVTLTPRLSPPPGSALVNLTNASIVATPQSSAGVASEGSCISITCSEIGNPGPNQFIVHTYVNCSQSPAPFFFQVVGR